MGKIINMRTRSFALHGGYGESRAEFGNNVYM